MVWFSFLGMKITTEHTENTEFFVGRLPPAAAQIIFSVCSVLSVVNHFRQNPSYPAFSKVKLPDFALPPV